MIRKKYTIEASVKTLARFLSVLERHANNSEAFVERVTPDSNDEYYYVVLTAQDSIHAHLKRNRFETSITLKPKE